MISLDARMHMTANAGRERFHSGADQYAAYLETPQGRLRSELALANLHDFLPRDAKGSLHALDIGCGTGVAAVHLARLGIHVTALDSSSEMLDIARQAARNAGFTEQIEWKHRDAVELTNSFPRSFDLVLCHNVLEYVENPDSVLRDAAGALRDSSAILSVLLRNRAGEVWKAAIKDGDLDAAEQNLAARWTTESLYGGRVRLFSTESLQAMLASASLAAVARRGVRIVSDYLPQSVFRNDRYQRIFELELELGRRPEFAAVARYSHWLARRADPLTEGGA